MSCKYIKKSSRMMKLMQSPERIEPMKNRMAEIDFLNQKI